MKCHRRPLPWLALGVAVATHLLAREPLRSSAWVSHETSIGGGATLELAGGTFLQLNTDTRILTRNTGARLQVALQRGEAFFSVTGYPVELRAKTVLANGSLAAFGVRDYGQGQVEVTVLEGSVAIESQTAEHSLRDKTLAPRTVSAGEVAMVRGSTLSVVEIGRDSVERKLAWREQRLEFLDEAVGDIADEFNRYGSTQVFVEDPYVKSLHIGGSFAPTDAGSFARTVGHLFALKVQTEKTRTGSVIRLTRDPKPSASTDASPLFGITTTRAHEEPQR